ncbi:hypothetical protein [Pedobacter rhizosphaerae]|uniref:Uncharacterized protein n=1 Tax=Pedobacter rhizosphaerae TaxID=390241 RepID=A0A1H9W6Q0_9SPHI|nr:hypothetical protein [Pedobacter rhizosphaerae]SES29558.1 hypothetical protein SAMN04488023_1608 [Pedobacter rhizosphaerae]
MKVYLILIVALCLACKQSSDEVPGVVIMNEKLNTYINSFVGQLKSKGVGRRMS